MNVLNVIKSLGPVYADSFARTIEIIVLSVVSLILILLVLWVVGTWKILTKANQPGWKALIPVYNKWTLCEISGINPYWSIIEVAFMVIIGIFLTIMSFASQNDTGDIVSYLLPTVSIYVNMLVEVSISKSFAKKDGFSLLSVFFPPICHMIIGFSNDKYVGPRPMFDPILGKRQNSNEQENEEPKDSNNDNTFCTNCGNKITSNNEYCTKCGKKIK